MGAHLKPPNRPTRPPCPPFPRPPPGLTRPTPVAFGFGFPPGEAGTGKTVVFAAVCLERAGLAGPALGKGRPRAVVVAPTREVALQAAAVCQRLTAALPGGGPRPVCEAFVGGLPEEADRRKLLRPCHVVCGTPGRLRALAAGGAMPADFVRTLVLDEADRLLGGGFEADLARLLQLLPPRKQVLAFSATFPDALLHRWVGRPGRAQRGPRG